MDPIGGAQSQVWGQQDGQGPGQMRRVLDGVSSLLGVDKGDLIQGLRSGESLADIASQKGVSRDDLLAAVTQALSSGTQGATNGVAAGPQGVDPSALAAQIVDRKGVGGHHHHHHHHVPQPSDQTTTASDGNSPFEQAFAELSSALGLSTSDLAQALQAGTSLFDLAAQQGVSQQAITDILGRNQGNLVDTSA
jgi:lambda repressor-like predicted transcriptional regulator